MSAAPDINFTADNARGPLQRSLIPSFDQIKKNDMTNYKLIGAAAVLLSLATPAMAKQRGDLHRYGYTHRVSPVRTFGSAFGAYDFYSHDNFAPENYSDDFDRRNTFN